ncbi:MAG: hypothetical protein ACTHMD_13125 [Flavisolibacter sp.]
MKIISTLFALLLYINAQSQVLRIKNVQKKEKSNLLLIDSSKLMNEFWAYKKTQNFLSIYTGSNYSFVSTPSILFYKGQCFLRKEKRLNSFDSVCIDFVYEYVMDYEWKERVKRNKSYWITFTFMYDDDKKKLSIKAEEMASQQFKSVYKIEKDVQ